MADKTTEKKNGNTPTNDAPAPRKKKPADPNITRHKMPLRSGRNGIVLMARKAQLIIPANLAASEKALILAWVTSLFDETPSCEVGEIPGTLQTLMPGTEKPAGSVAPPGGWPTV